MLIALALQAAVVPPPPRDAFADRAWGHFSRSPALAGSNESVDVATATGGPRTQALAYTMRLTRRRPFHSDEILWADSRTCPAVRSVLQAMQALPPPRLSVPGIERSPSAIIVDGIGYSLSAPAHFVVGEGEGSLWFSSNVGTPLAAWVDHSLATLERCWSPVELRMR